MSEKHDPRLVDAVGDLMGKVQRVCETDGPLSADRDKQAQAVVDEMNRIEAGKEKRPIPDEMIERFKKAEAEIEAGGRWCYYIVDSEYDEGHGYVPVIVRENESGYHPMRGDGSEFAVPWYWGKDIDTAERIARERNAEMGLTEHDVDEIVSRNMRNKPKRARG